MMCNCCDCILFDCESSHVIIYNVGCKYIHPLIYIFGFKGALASF